MPKINGKIYYNNVTGNVLLVVNQNEGVWLRETTFEEDVATYPQLKEVNDDIISVIRLQWDQYKEDFAISRPVKVEGGIIKWELFDEPTAPPTDVPLSQKVEEVKLKSEQLMDEVQALQDVVMFLTSP